MLIDIFLCNIFVAVKNFSFEIKILNMIKRQYNIGSRREVQGFTEQIKASLGQKCKRNFGRKFRIKKDREIFID